MKADMESPDGNTLTFDLPVYGITVELTKARVADANGNYYKSGKIESLLTNEGVQRTSLAIPDDAFNGAMQGIEAMILAHACAGIDIKSPAYIEGITTAVTAISNYFGD